MQPQITFFYHLGRDVWHTLCSFGWLTKNEWTNLCKSRPSARRQFEIRRMKKPQNPEVTGIIMPNNWDKNGKVIQIAIYTNAEEVYLVEPNQTGQELLSHINRRVEVRGKKRECLDGNRYIAVQKYTILEELVEDEKLIKNHSPSLNDSF